MAYFLPPYWPYTCLRTLRDQTIHPLSKEEAEKGVAKLYTDGKSEKSFTLKGESSTEAGSVLDAHLKTMLRDY
ncbi:hypothetical protein EUTSA_v10011916mg [Eutrema salsugineum]|uniref:Uncharacterized protein n=1 Tax=Eutrema salsugineum TaxID=72664 RepID=V4KGJ5_EUTSA|nr:hypothetical protein EUTSA_v10011916mg [Eutrema salsugineum]